MYNNVYHSDVMECMSHVVISTEFILDLCHFSQLEYEVAVRLYTLCRIFSPRIVFILITYNGTECN